MKHAMCICLESSPASWCKLVAISNQSLVYSCKHTDEHCKLQKCFQTFYNSRYTIIVYAITHNANPSPTSTFQQFSHNGSQLIFNYSFAKATGTKLFLFHIKEYAYIILV